MGSHTDDQHGMCVCAWDLFLSVNHEQLQGIPLEDQLSSCEHASALPNAPEAVWGDLLPVLKSAHAVFANLETPISARCVCVCVYIYIYIPISRRRYLLGVMGREAVTNLGRQKVGQRGGTRLGESKFRNGHA